MLYDNDYNRNLARQMHTISQRYIDNAKIVGGAILGGTVLENSESECDSDYNEGGNGFAEGTHLDTGFGPTLGASPLDKITKETIIKEAKLAQGGAPFPPLVPTVGGAILGAQVGGAKYDVNTAHQTLMGGPQMGLGKREGKGFWDDFKHGFDSTIDTVGKIATTAAAIAPLVKMVAGKRGRPKGSGKKGKGILDTVKNAADDVEAAAKVGHVLEHMMDPSISDLSGMGRRKLVPRDNLPSSSMGGANVAQDIQNANEAFNVGEMGNDAGVDGNTVGGHEKLADKFKPVLKALADHSKKLGRQLKVSDYDELLKHKVFDKVKPVLEELPALIGVTGKGKRASLEKELKGKGIMDTLGPLMKFAPLLLGLGKHKGKGFLSGLLSDIGLGKKKEEGKGFISGLLSDIGLGKKKGKGEPALDKGANEELEDLPKAMAEKGGKKKGAKAGFLPQEVLSKVGGRKPSEWALLVKKVMADNKFKKMADAIAHIKKNGLYKKK